MAVHSAVTTDSSSTGGSSSVNRAIRNAIRSDGDTTKFLRADWKFAVPTGGGGNGVDVTVDFGSSFTHYAETVVTGETWVTSTSKIVATPKASDGSGIEAAILSFQPCVGNLVNGDGFTLRVYTPVEAKGTYTFTCVGV